MDNINFDFEVELEFGNLFLLILDSKYFTRLLTDNLLELTEHVHDFTSFSWSKDPSSLYNMNFPFETV